MAWTTKARAGIAEAVAVARDEALIEMGRKAELRQQERQVEVRRGPGGTAAVLAVVAGAALAAGAVAYQVRKRRNGKGPAEAEDHAPMGNGTASEHEHKEA